MRATTSKIAVAIAGAALIVGVSGCGESNDSAGPTVADVQKQALAAQEKLKAAQQDPGLRYAPLPTPAVVPLYKDPPFTPYADAPPLPINQLQPGQDPVATALQRIQEISAKTADISNRANEARQYFAGVDPLYDAVKKELDGNTRDKLEKGFKDMRSALDASAVAISAKDQVKTADALSAAEEASGDIQVAIYHYLKDNFTPHPDEQKRETFCSPTDTYPGGC